MVRITKDPQVRMTEILDAAEELFYVRGYHETAVSDIVKSIGVAQGTFLNCNCKLNTLVKWQQPQAA